MMSPETSAATVVALFEDSNGALKAIDALREAGFEREQIGFLARKYHGSLTGEPPPPSSSSSSSEPDAQRDAVLAGVLVTGMAAGAMGAAPLMPGAGPILASGAIGGTLIAMTALTGGIRAALTGTGMSEDEARYYETEYDSDRSIVVVKTPVDRSQDASRILKANGGVGRVRAGEPNR